MSTGYEKQCRRRGDTVKSGIKHRCPRDMTDLGSSYRAYSCAYFRKLATTMGVLINKYRMVREEFIFASQKPFAKIETAKFHAPCAQRANRVSIWHYFLEKTYPAHNFKQFVTHAYCTD